jgi:hypothetical protein
MDWADPIAKIRSTPAKITLFQAIKAIDYPRQHRGEIAAMIPIDKGKTIDRWLRAIRCLWI